MSKTTREKGPTTYLGTVTQVYINPRENNKFFIELHDVDPPIRFTSPLLLSDEDVVTWVLGDYRMFSPISLAAAYIRSANEEVEDDPLFTYIMRRIGDLCGKRMSFELTTSGGVPQCVNLDDGELEQSLRECAADTAKDLLKGRK